MGECFDRLRAARSQQYLYIRNDFPQLPWAQRLDYMEFMPVTHEMRQMHAGGRLHGDAALWMQERKPAEELYDTRADPHCLRNLAGDAAYSETLASHRGAVEAWVERIDDQGYTSEQALIDAGVVVDRLTEEYGIRFTPLPEPLRAGGTYDAYLTEADVPPA